MLGTMVKCHGSYQARQKWPDIDLENDAAEYGTAAHWYAEQLGKVEIGDKAPNGVLIDQDIALYTKPYIERIKQLTSISEYCGVETKVNLPMLLEGMFGTVDLWAYDIGTKTLHVEDLKFGFNVVEADDNFQLAAYAIGLLEALGFNGHTEQDVTVEMTIHQPRAWHPMGTVRTWRVKATDLRATRNIIINTINAVLSGRPLMFKSGNHCKYCNGKLYCPAAISAGYNAVDVITTGSLLDDQPIETLESMFVTLTNARRALENLYSAVELTLQSEVEKGAYVNRVGIVKGQSRRKWSRDDKEIITLGKLFGFELTEEKVLSPAKAEQLGIDPEVIKPYITKTRTAPKLKVTNGKTLTEKVFQNAKTK
jgi:hypothetical protein